MSFNLVDAAKGLLSSELVNKASSFLGESESGVGAALSGILPTVLGGLADKSATTEGANVISRMAGEQNQSGILDNLGSFFGSDSGSLLSKGANALSSIFGDKVGGLTSLLSSFSGIKSSSTSSLLGMIAPVVLGFLGKHAATNNLNAGGLANLLSSQKDNISKAIPPGLNLSSIFGNATSNVSSAAKSTVASANHYAEETVEKTGGALKWLLPFLLLALAAAAAWYLFSKGCGKEAEPAAVVGTDSVTKVELVPVAPTTAVGMVDSTGNYVYDLGKMVTIDLPNSAGKLTVGENSTENKLYKFLTDASATIDSVKGNWFEFTNVRFVTGGSKIDSASSAQLKNIVAISKGFPTASFKLGGYTDNTGDSVANIALSQKRSEAVVAELKKLGTSSKSITGAKGYGPQYPIGDNATAEGKAMNRRVALNVKSK
jgi:OmpA-OmpF porin, OOP family